jgi:hypothetical protein
VRTCDRRGEVFAPFPARLDALSHNTVTAATAAATAAVPTAPMRMKRRR